MTTPCGGSDIIPNCIDPDKDSWSVDSWVIDVGFSPRAPWSCSYLKQANSDETSSVLIQAPSSVIYGRFEKALPQAMPRCLPTSVELRSLLDMRDTLRERTRPTILRQVSPLGVMDDIVGAAGIGGLKTGLAMLLTEMNDESFRPILYAKLRGNRVRAYQILPDLAPDFLHGKEFPMHPAFPSGHSTQAHLMMNAIDIVFANAKYDPVRGREMAKSIGQNREIAGLHYSSDTEAGRIMANVLVDTASRSQKFKEMAAEARKQYSLAPI